MHVVNLAFFDAFIIFGWPTKAHSAFVAGFEGLFFRIVFFGVVVPRVKSFPADRVSLRKCMSGF